MQITTCIVAKAIAMPLLSCLFQNPNGPQSVFLWAPSMSTAPIIQSIEKKSHRFTEGNISQSVCLPQYHRVVSTIDMNSSSPSCFSHAQSEVGTQICPVHDNIAFVHFAYAKDQQIDCINCLMQHSQVYLLYTAEITPDGYVWMRQAPANILKLCVGNLCTSLVYDEQIMQIQRPAELLQLTTDASPFKRSKGT